MVRPPFAATMLSPRTKIPRQIIGLSEWCGAKSRDIAAPGVVTRRSYGFRTYDAMEIALYHNLGRLPEPESTHRFC